ncbi:Fur family transcriptional regulator [Herbidospora cretacea]|uniref:Fur family transcriptional regulator n=1 Tax=Herbidospora cretacea TaxID=28444 RepID=UPI000772F0DE|nr:transcriptional repressor [Herbidospora cretacea]
MDRIETDQMLADRGLRRTGARMAILTILERTNTHHSVSTLAQLAAAVRPTINASSVYRNVTAMTESGVLHCIEWAGELLYGLAITPHHHLICQPCGTLLEIPAGDLDRTAADLATGRRFTLNQAGQLLLGRCHQCSAA